MNRHLARIPRYTLVAIGCAVLHNVILIAADAFGANYFWCQVASSVVLMPTGFLLQSHFTFQCDRSWRGFLRYSGALMTNFPLLIALLWLSREYYGLPMWLVAPLSSIVLFVWNYMTSCWALARGHHRKESPAHG